MPVCSRLGATALPLTILSVRVDGIDVNAVSFWADFLEIGPKMVSDRNGGQPRFAVIAVILTFLLGMAMIGCGVGWTAAGEDATQPSNLAFSKRIYKDADGGEHRYVLFAPPRSPNSPQPPVILFLNGHGQNGDDGVLQITNQFGIHFWECRGFSPFIGIAPQCRKNGEWSADSLDTQWAFAILDDVLREYDGDEDRVYLTGVSTGGNGIWKVASAHPERFAAIVPLCATHGADVDRLIASRLPIWNFWNAGDHAGVVNFNRDLKQKLIEHGGSPLCTEYPAVGHDCWNRAYSTTALYAWLLRQNRRRNRSAEPFEYLPSKQLIAEWPVLGDSHWSANNDGDLIGQAGSGDDAASWLASPKSATAFDLHGEVWLENTTHCELAIWTVAGEEQQLAALISILPRDQGVGGVCDAQGRSAVSLDPAAQQALRLDNWNDVRVQVANSTLTLWLNGWPALQAPMVTTGKSDERYRVGLAAPRETRDARWRLIRTRMNSPLPVPIGRGEP